jgi:hypothetical protein
VTGLPSSAAAAAALSQVTKLLVDAGADVRMP